LPPAVIVPFGTGPEWFPDNASLLVVTRDDRGLPVFHRLRLPAGSLETIHRPDESNFSSFSLAPDGRAIFFVNQHVSDTTLEDGRIVRYDIDARRETILKRDEWFIAVSASPDGKSVAYVKSIRPPDRQATRSVIEVMPADGGPSREIFSDPRWYSGHRYNTLGWTPDSRAVLFVDEDGALRQVPAAGGQAVPMGVAMVPRIKTPVIHPDGRRLAFGSVDTDTNETWVLENVLPRRQTATP
jgi:Tol biopolymer transport system component